MSIVQPTNVKEEGLLELPAEGMIIRIIDLKFHAYSFSKNLSNLQFNTYGRYSIINIYPLLT